MMKPPQHPVRRLIQQKPQPACAQQRRHQDLQPPRLIRGLFVCAGRWHIQSQHRPAQQRLAQPPQQHQRGRKHRPIQRRHQQPQAQVAVWQIALQLLARAQHIQRGRRRPAAQSRQQRQ